MFVVVGFIFSWWFKNEVPKDVLELPKPSKELVPYPQRKSDNNISHATKIFFLCQQAHGSPLALISGFSSRKELYQRIAECYNFPPEDILFCTLNTYEVDMKKLLEGQIGKGDLIFAHRKGRLKEIEIVKTEDDFGVILGDNGAGYVFVKKIIEGSMFSKIPDVEVGDHIERIDGLNVVGNRHFKVVKMLNDIPVGTVFTVGLVEPLKSNFCGVSPAIKSQCSAEDAELQVAQLQDLQDEQVHTDQHVMPDKELQTLIETCHQCLQTETHGNEGWIEGWSESSTEILELAKTCRKCEENISECDELLYKDHRVIVPEKFKNELLLRYAHFGLEKISAGQLFLCPKVNNQIENLIANCQACSKDSVNNAKHSQVPQRPWSKIGVHFFRNSGRCHLIIIDYYSRFVEVRHPKNFQTCSIINELRSVFSSHGIPETLLLFLDGGWIFVREEFDIFSKCWGFSYVHSLSYHPQPNGLAERAVQTIKNLIEKYEFHPEIDYRLGLLQYLNTPISNHLPSPSEILQNRKLHRDLHLQV